MRIIGNWYEEKITAVASAAFAEMMREPWRRQYVWFTRGDLVAAPDRPPGMEIATPEPIPSDRTREAVRAWIWEKCRRVECLPES